MTITNNLYDNMTKFNDNVSPNKCYISDVSIVFNERV